MTTSATPPVSDAQAEHFATRLLAWFTKHGRHDLPWQQHLSDCPDAYQVWVSEVMLQQTQVATVIPYFERFVASFPNVAALAEADWETVAEHWAGLGYYARARNLHKGAKQLVDIINTTGQLPQSVAGWEQISGVGRSTAGAIVAMGLHDYGVICDGNVKRVLTRWAGIDGDVNKAATNKQLWQLATQLTPAEHSGHFAQAMMDVGATVCTRSKPACLLCPLQSDCVAKAQGNPTAYPVKAKKAPKPSKYSHALLLYDVKGRLLWLMRPDTGIWGGLWCLPLQFVKKTQGNKTIANADNDTVFEQEQTTAEQVTLTFLQQHDIEPQPPTLTPNTQSDPNAIKHTLTHFHWHLTPCVARLSDAQTAQLSSALTKADIPHQWLAAGEASRQLALPKAMDKMLNALGNS